MTLAERIANGSVKLPTVAWDGSRARKHPVLERREEERNSN